MYHLFRKWCSYLSNESVHPSPYLTFPHLLCQPHEVQRLSNHEGRREERESQLSVVQPERWEVGYLCVTVFVYLCVKYLLR